MVMRISFLIFNLVFIHLLSFSIHGDITASGEFCTYLTGDLSPVNSDKSVMEGHGVMGYVTIRSGEQSNEAILEEEFLFREAPFQSCHASTLAETSTGLVAAWFAGTHEKHPDVEIWLSTDEGGGWSEPIAIASGKNGEKRYPCWNPVLYYSEGGRLYLFYKVGPSPSEWWGMMKISDDNGHTWNVGERLPQGFLGPIKNKPEPVSQHILLCPSSTENGGWKVHMERFDLVNHKWERRVAVDHTSQFEVIQPAILSHSDGMLQILCRSKQGFIISSRSSDRGISWSALRKTILPNPNSGIDAVTLQDGKHLLVYNHTGIPPGQWGGNRFPLNLAISLDGENWKAGLVLEAQEGEYSYPAIIETVDGRVHITYTWKRQKIKHVVIDPDLISEQDISIWDK